MSAYNNQTKALKGFDGKIHITNYDGSTIYYSYSLDNGLSFVPWRIVNVDYPSGTPPDLATDASGIPYISFGATEQVGGGSYRMRYYVMRADVFAYPDCYYQSISDNIPPTAPSLIFIGNNGYIASKNINGQIFVAGSYNPNGTPTVIISNSGNYPALGYDAGGRMTVVMHDGSGSIKLCYCPSGQTNWTTLNISQVSGAYALGAPSLWAGNNEISIAFEGYEGSADGLLYMYMPWHDGFYDVPVDAEIVTVNTDYSNDCLEGYSYIASKDLVLWKYDDIDNNDDDDIFYSQKRANQWTLPENISGTTDPDEISSYPQGFVTSGIVRPKLFTLWTEKVGTSYYLVRKIINLPLAYQNITMITESETPEATAYNNAARMLKDNQGTLHLAFTNGNNVYHTYHNPNDTIWSEPGFLGEGKYPALALGPDGKLYCIWCYHGYQEFQGVPYYVEYLRMRSFDGVSWSKPTKLLFHTYGTYLWGVGAPSLAIKDTMAYVTFKSYHGPTFNPTPGEPYPYIVVVEGPALIYGSFPLNNPDAFAYQIIDTIIKTPNPVDTLTYRDSLVPLLISPSITVDLAGIPHILWEGDSTAMRYYTITDSGISRQLFDINISGNVDFPSLVTNGDQVQLLWTAKDSIRYRYGWTNTEHLSQPITIAACENTVASGPYLAWTKQDGYLSHLYYGAIPASGVIEPIEINYSTDLISYPQVSFNPEKQNQTPSLDLVWTEYSLIDSLDYIYYLNLPLTEETPMYAFDMGTEIPVPLLIQRDGFLAYGSEDFKTIDYDSTELIYHLALHSPHKKYMIKWTYYHQEPDKIKLDFSIDNILHHNRWVNPYEQVTQETWIPDSCLVDNEITIKVKNLSGTLAVLSGFEIYERLVGGSGPQGSEVMISQPFFLDRIYPNPAKGMIKIRFNSPDERQVSIKIYDISGRLVEKLFTGRTHIGMNEVVIMAGELANGIYFMKLDADKYGKVEKLILLK
jgi:hypothetical protein